MFAGFRGSGSFAVDERPKNFREFILWRDPNGRTPLTALLSKTRSEGTDDPQIFWWEEQLDIIRLQLDDATNMSAVDTTFTVDSGALQLNQGDMILIETAQDVGYTAELVEVSSVTSDTVFEGIRGAAGSTAAIILDNTFMTRIGNSFEEGSLSADITGTNPDKLTNFCQIFKTAFGVTKTTDHIKLRTGPAFKNDRFRKMFRHSESLEQAFLWGKAAEIVTGSFPQRYAGGAREFITTSVTIFTVDPTEDSFINAVTPIFDFHSEGAGDQRLMLCGNGAMTTLNRLARDSTNSRINLGEVITLYGMKLRRWILPMGELLVRTHPLLNVHPVHTNSMFILNPAGLIYRHLRDTAVEKNIQTPGEDVIKDQWLTESTLELRHERTMAFIGEFKDFP
ncbi:MAG: hypothetical protein FVQ79_00240 [Planctomycetes bacterium]|nr:hypothetical protein [Planctomycetota bacterium]